MKPLLLVVAYLAFTQALPENIEDIKELPQSKDPIVEAEEPAPQERKERCTTCKTVPLNIQSPNAILSRLQAIPGSEVHVHSQQSFQECSSDKGCAGLKLKDGKVVEKYGNIDAFKAAATADNANEFTFHAGGLFGNVFEGGIPNDGPFWWMNQNSPFKAAAAAQGGNFEKFSKSSSSYSSSGGGALGAGNAGAGGAGFGAALDLSGNPFLNGEFSKIAGQFSSAGAEVKPAAYQSSFSESSSFTTANKEIDLANNPYIQAGSGASKFGASGSGFQAQGSFGSQNSAAGSNSAFRGQNAGFAGQDQAQGFSAQSQFAGGKFGAGYTGSSPSPFTAATGGSNVNLIPGSQKASEFEFEQQQQNIDEAFQGTGNVHAHEHSDGGSLQQTCAGQGYVCVHKAQCNNGVVNTNGAGILQAKTKKQYCNVKTEICCRIEISTLSGAGGLQGSLGVGSATYSGQGSQSGGGLFVSSSQSGATDSGASGANGFGGANGGASGFGGTNGGASGFGGANGGASGFGGANGGASGFGGANGAASGFGGANGGASGFGGANGGASGFNGGNGGAFESGQSSFESSSSSFEASFGAGSRGAGNQGGIGGAGQGFGATGTAGSSGFNAQGGQGSQSSFGSSSSTGFEAQGTFGSRTGPGSGTFGSQGAAGSFGIQAGVGSGSGSTTGFGAGFGPGSGSNTGFGAGAVNRGVTVQESSSTFESRTGTFGSPAGTAGSAGASGNKFGAAGTFGTNFGATGSTPAPVPLPIQPNQFGTGNEVVYKQTSQSNFIETDSFSAGSENNGVFRPGSPGPGIPYLPPVDATISATNQVSSTAFPTTQRPFSTPKPTYLPPPTTQAPTYLPPPVSTQAPTYLPPQQPEQSINTETRVPTPSYNDGSLILDATRTTARPFNPPPPPIINEVPSACAAALKCTPIEYCTAEGVISNTTVLLTKDQDAYRVPLTDCKILESGAIGKCCRDPFYTDPWPVNQLGKWVPNTFGGNDGKYTPDSRGSGSISRIQVTPGPFTGSTQLNAFSSKPTAAPGPNQVSFTSQSQKGQYEIKGQGQGVSRGQGQYSIGGQGQFGQGSIVTAGQNYNRGSIQLDANRQASGQGQAVIQGQGQTITQGQGFGVQGGRGQYDVQGQGQYSKTETQKTFGTGVIQGQGQAVSQGFGQGVRQGQGQIVSQGQGQIVSQGQGQAVSQGFGQGVSQGQGQAVITGQGQTASQRQGFGQGARQIPAGIIGQGQAVSQGFGQGVRQGSGFAVSQGGGFSVENEYNVSEQRVFLQRFDANGQCGLLNGQKPYGNRNDNEVDFAEIPWQAMVLLQTNKSLLCGGVITRPDVVLTSAACVDGLDAKNVLIKGGEWKLGIDDEPLPFQIVQVKNILRHPFYKKGSLLYDAAILVLAENLRFAKNIYPICLPRAGETLDAFYNGAGECIVTGWGKQVLQAHLQGSILHSLNISLINPGECEARLAQDYPHLLSEYDRDSCTCGLPSNPTNNICRVDIGSALACTTDNKHFVLRGIYSWDSGCQLGNQIAAFYKFDLEWYEWAIGLIESTRFAQLITGSQILGQNKFSGQINSGVAQVSKGGFKGQFTTGGKYSEKQSGFAAGQSGFGAGQSGFAAGQSGFGSGQSGFAAGQDGFAAGQSGFTTGQFGQFSASGGKFGADIKPITNSFSASYTEKKVFQSEPKIVTFTTKPEIVTFTTKPEYFTYTIKPEIVTYTTKPQIIRYETSGSVTNPQYVAPGVTFNPSFSELVGKGHTHNAQCKCLDGKK